MTTRRPLTRAHKLTVFNNARGICHICRRKIHAGEKWEAEHVIALWAGGKDEMENMAPAHLDPCHRGKSGEEATGRAKELRQRANHLGIPKPGKKLPCGRDSDTRKKLTGEVVTRQSQSEKHRALMIKLHGEQNQ